MSTDPSKYVFNHTMIRVKDPKASIQFYTDILGMNMPGVLELTHNWGTEDQPDFAYANGNTEVGRGFGHTAILVSSLSRN
ncbi:hypothetical protein G6F42_027411 [Rhizopus arrhizus]|nr:hypothetical protein G6F42_027411 [Rhizopus arrhizus]